MKINGLSANIYKPQKPAGKLAIILPGYLDSKDYDHLVALGQGLSRMDYLAVSFDPTGTWDSDGQIGQYSSMQYLNDVAKLISTLTDENKEPFGEIILLGHSMGGQVAILYAARHPEDIASVVGIMPSSDPFKTSFQKYLPEWEKQGFRRSIRDLPEDPSKTREFIVPFSFFQDRNQYNTLSEIKNFHGKTILIAGSIDTTVPPETVKEIYESANQQKEYIELLNIGHGYRHSEEQIAIVNNAILNSL